MRRIFKANWLLNTSELRNQKYAKIVMLAMCLILIVAFEGLKVLLERHLNFHISNIYIIYMIFVMSEVLLFPMQIYKQILFRKEEIMLFMAGIEKKSIYSYYFLKNIMVANLIIFLGSRLFLETIIVEWRLINTMFLMLISSAVFIEIFFMELLIKYMLKRSIYREITVIISIEEIISSIVCYSYINKIDYKVYKLHINASKSIVAIIAMEILYMINRIILIKKNNQVSYYKKECLMLIRNFDSLKYIVVSIMLYIIPITVSKNKPEYENLIIVVLVFIINIIIVLGIGSFKNEKEYGINYFLAMYDEKKFKNEKKKFFEDASFGAVLFLNMTLIITQKLGLKKILILYVISFLLCKINAMFISNIEHKALTYYNNNRQKIKKWKEIFDEKQ